MTTINHDDNRPVLVLAIESADTSDLTGLQRLYELTRSWFTSTTDQAIDAWPSSVFEVMRQPDPDARVIQRMDAFDQMHQFVVVSVGPDTDLLLGVSSRRERNVPGVLSENLATNILVEIIRQDLDHQTQGRYRAVYSVKSDRLWRTGTGAAHLQASCREAGTWLEYQGGQLNPHDDGSTILGAVAAAVDSQQADLFISNSAGHRRAGHENGRSAFARSKTHIALSLDQNTGQMSWDPAVVPVLRAIVDELLAGAGWDEIADTFAAQLPAYTLREEPDRARYESSSRRTRRKRNQHRQRRGQAKVELQYLDDGVTPNPAYRPETLADLADPASAIRKIFRGPTLPRTLDTSDLDTLVSTHLDGVDPRTAYIDFLATGTYRRLHRDQNASSLSRSVHCWISYQLDPYDDQGYVIRPRQAADLKRLLAARRRTAPASGLPLTGLFDVTLATPELFTNRGLVTHDKGRVAFRTAHNTQADDGYRIYFEPWKATVHGVDCLVLAWLPAAELHRSIVDTVVEAVDDPDRAADFAVRATALRDDHDRRRGQLEDERREAHREFEGATLALASPALSEAQRGLLQKKADSAEARLEQAIQALAEIPESATMREAASRLGTLPDLLALLLAHDRIPADLQRAANRLLRTILRDATIRLDPATASCRWTATLTLATTDGGTIVAPLSGQVPNRAVDTWLAGPGGMFWTGTPFSEAWDHLGKKTPVGAASRWRRPIIDRLLESPGAGTPFASRAAANLFVRCPDPAIVAVGLSVHRDEQTQACDDFVRLVNDLFFHPVGTQPKDWRHHRGTCQA